MAPAPALAQSSYDAAAAVFSRSFRFVEWKYIIALKGASAPLGDHGTPRASATRPLDRQKWIYVFRTDYAHETYSPIKEEIRVDADGQMFATPYEQLEKVVAQRGTPVALGKTMCLPRRIMGKPKVYRFYASRVRLPLPQIKALEKTIHTFAPPTILDPGDNTSVIEKNGETLVPVVDPITVALHLHAAFTAASNDIVNYTAPHADLPAATQRTVTLRRKKQLLGTILKGIIGDEKKTSANNLVQELKDSQWALENYLKHYDTNLDWRVGRRDRFATFLTKWLTSDAMAIAAAAHHGARAWAQFLVPWCHAITRLFDSPRGRDYLTQVLNDKKHFVHTYVWPQKELSGDAQQAVRKGGMTVIEAWGEFAGVRVSISGTNALPQITQSLRRVRSLKPDEKVSTWYKEVKAADRTIKATQLIDPGPAVRVHNNFKTEAKALGGVIESVNLILAIKAVETAMQGDDPRAKELAVINLVGSTLDAASAIGSMVGKGRRVVPVLSFASGVIDVYLGVTEMNKAFKDGDEDIANGAFLTAAGSTIGTAGAFMTIGAIPGGQIVAIVGLLVVSIGYLYKFLKGKEPLQRFFNRCSWGKNHRQPGGADWSPTRFEQWTGDKEFDYQLEALLNIVCKLEIKHTDSYRDLEYAAAWLPANSKLTFKYEEVWRQPADDKTIEGEIVLAPKGPKSSNARVVATAKDPNKVRLTLTGGLSMKSPNPTVRGKRFPHDDLKKAAASGKLLITLDGASTVTVPHKGWEQKVLFKR